jgi:RNA polymerase III subunit RPC82 helix-turn-helix domain
MSKEFLCYLVKQQYGQYFEQLILPFFDHEELQLTEIIRYSKLVPEEVRSMMIILVKNDIVDYQEKIEGGNLLIIYRLNIENVINISMYPRFLSFMEEKFSILARSLIETLILNGKMTVEDCMLGTKDQLLLELGPDAGLEENDYLNEFGNLVLLNYITAVHKALPAEPTDRRLKLTNSSIKEET